MKAPLGEAQPLVVHASQQLGFVPTHAVPPLGAVHELAVLLVLQLVLPFVLVRQHVTKSGLPHVERDAHLTTAPLQLLLSSTVFAVCAAHETYVP
jgi:hypothetical protein